MRNLVFSGWAWAEMFGAATFESGGGDSLLPRPAGSRRRALAVWTCRRCCSKSDRLTVAALTPQSWTVNRLMIDVVDKVRVPMHLFFELECMLMREIQTRGAQPKGTDRITANRPFEIEPFRSTSSSSMRIENPALPDVKAGDFIFLAMAKKEGAVLVTSDDKLLKAARKAEIPAFTLAEFARLIDTGRVLPPNQRPQS